MPLRVLGCLFRARRMTELTEVAVTAFGLGLVAMLGAVLVILHFAADWSVRWLAVGAHLLTSVALFHMSEFLVAAQFRPHDASPMAFMIYHSNAYVAAVLAAWVEFAVEVLFIPDDWKFVRMTPMSVLAAAALVVAFYMVRVVGMVQCASNFSLQIECSRRESHKLVTTGLYAFLRHPAYFGWFWQAIFSQLVLMNPLCLVAYTIVTHRFFAARIPFEESVLESNSFFGAEYKEYKRRTVTGIPGIL